jgi:S-adenosylmethionine:tRNA ribosyltransferase-isomerase
MIVDRTSGTIRHTSFPNIADVVTGGDTIVLNDSRVVAARLRGCKETGGRIEALLLSVTGPVVSAMVRSSKPLRANQSLRFEGGYEAHVHSVASDGVARLDFGDVNLANMLREIGEVPLPPYVRPVPEAANMYRERYQTVYARRDGSVAAPTAGLHFTELLLSQLAEKGVHVRFVTLHVGPGTFRPIRDRPEDHRMDAELCDVPVDTVAAIERTRREGRRVVAVGTTTVRALESAARSGRLAPHRGSTDLFIKPGYRFQAVDCLLTNFHLPRSSLLCLVMAFAGEELTRKAYRIAVDERYRFYSFGDAMLVV